MQHLAHKLVEQFPKVAKDVHLCRHPLCSRSLLSFHCTDLCSWQGDQRALHRAYVYGSDFRHSSLHEHIE